MDTKSKKTFIFGVIIFIVFVSLGSGWLSSSLKALPEQSWQVEVVGKRTKYFSASESTLYAVTFKFPDDSVKTFNAMIAKHYNAIHEGDTGKLTCKTYKRYIPFERFEKDSHFGGIKIEPYRENDIIEMAQIIIGWSTIGFFVWVIPYGLLLIKWRRLRKKQSDIFNTGNFRKKV